MNPKTVTSICLDSFGDKINAAVIGASGGIGRALADAIALHRSTQTVLRLSRRAADRDQGQNIAIDITDESSVATAALRAGETCDSFDIILVATGFLHGDGLKPEKSWRALDRASLERGFLVNAIGPALVAKHFLPLLRKGRKSAFAVLSARVGSIGDNRLGGWHSYRASKSALNMLVRTLSVELARRNATALCVSLHPGTVETALSRPFHGRIPKEMVFQTGQAAAHLLNVLDRLTTAQSGFFFDWKGQPIPF